MKNIINQIILVMCLIIVPIFLYAEPSNWKIGFVPVIPLNINAYNVLWGFEISNNDLTPLEWNKVIIRLSGYFGTANALEKSKGEYTEIYGISLLKTNIRDFTTSRTITNVKTTYIYVELIGGWRWELASINSFSNGIDLMFGLGYSGEFFSGKFFSTENYDLGYISGFELPLYIGYYFSPVKIFEKPLYITIGTNIILTGGKAESHINSNLLYWIKLGVGIII